MTNEEIQQTLTEIDAGIKHLSDPEKKLTGKERSRKRVLQMKKDTLERLIIAKANQNFNQEVKLMTNYGLLTSLGEKHPFLLYFLSNKFRMNIF